MEIEKQKEARMNLDDWKIENLFLDQDSRVYRWLSKFTHVWEAIPHIEEFIMYEINNLDMQNYVEFSEGVYIHKSVKLAENIVIEGPTIIAENCEIRPSAYIRGKVYVAENSVLGNSCEFKNAILMNNVQVPHFSYVGDSILGEYTHFGASAIASNFRQDKQKIKIKLSSQEIIQTELRKMGVVSGAYVEVGSGSILNPGTLIGKNSRVYPLITTRYAIAANTILKSSGEVVELRAN